MSEVFPTAQQVLARYGSRATQLPDGKVASLLQSADHWDQLADEEDRAVDIGIELASCPAAQNRSRTYRRTAHSLRIQAETGIPVCTCHFLPSDVANDHRQTPRPW